MEFLTPDKARANIENIVEERLSRIAETDFDALFSMQEQRIKAEKERRRNTAGRRHAAVEGQISFIDLTAAADAAPEPEVIPEPEPEPEIIPEPEPEVIPEPEPEQEIAPVPTPKPGPAPTKQKMFTKKFIAGFDVFASGMLLETANQKVITGFAKISAVVIISALWLLAAIRKIPVPNLTYPEWFKWKPIKTDAVKLFLLKFKRRIARHERKVSSRMAGLIGGLDRGNDKIILKSTEVIVSSDKHVTLAREWADFNKRKLLAGLVVLIAMAVSAVSVANYFTAYVYAYNGRALGMVKNQEDVLRVHDVVSEQLTREYGAEIEINEERNITFEKVFSTNVNDEIDDMQEVFNRLTYMQDMNVHAYALYIDNTRIAIFDTEDRVQNLLNSFRDIYLQSPQYLNVDYESVSFAEEVDIRQIDTQLGRIQNTDEVIDVMLTGAIAEKIHTVEKGETFSGIAKKYGMTQAELEASNPGITPARLSIGQEIVLSQSVPLLTVQTVEVAVYPDVIPYETIYEDNPKIFKGEQSTRVKGVNGEREVTARIIRNNGFEIAREELNSKIIVEPSSAIIMRGTKDPPPLQGTGKLKYPVSGYRLTSKFGTRGGRMHSGIDMACRSGTRIGAADGGTVTFAGYNGALGYTVIINHGGNMETLYGHCSALHVKRGDKVYQGQHIANVGSTGRSTGPHLHFEVHINGVPKNPLSYL